MDKPPVYILAGGGSSRFGSDKATASINGAPAIHFLARRYREAGHDVTAVATEANRFESLGIRTIADVVDNAGPMGGLHAALIDLPDSTGRLFLTSCDMLNVQPSWIVQLTKAIDGAAREVFAAAFKPDVWQPLFAVYHREVLSEVERRLESNDHAMWRFLEAVDALEVSTPNNWPARVQFNTPAELTDIVNELTNGRR